jgi:hypothetical protein
MEMTGWLDGQVFLQTVDSGEVTAVTEFLTGRGISYQVLTLSERMVVGDAESESDTLGEVSAERFSIAIQLAGFPQVLGPALNDLIQRAHGGGWVDAEPS